MPAPTMTMSKEWEAAMTRLAGEALRASVRDLRVLLMDSARPDFRRNLEQNKLDFNGGAHDWSAGTDTTQFLRRQELEEYTIEIEGMVF